MGGKTRLAKEILPYFPNHTCYTEPFAGGLGMLLSKEKSRCEVINDISNDLVTLYRVIQNHPDELAKQFEYQITSRKQFDDLKTQTTDTLTDIQKAARYLYLQKLCFGGSVESKNFGTATTHKSRLNTDTLQDNISKLHDRLKQVFIENLDWKNIIEKYDRPHTLFYCDPPYFQSASYGVPFEWQEYEKLAAYMNSIKGAMLISINDHPDIRRLFADFKMIELETVYTNTKGRREAKELLILNKQACKVLDAN